MHFCKLPERKSLNIYSRKKFFAQNLQEKKAKSYFMTNIVLCVSPRFWI